MHNIKIQLLDELNEICKKEGIQYFLYGKTLQAVFLNNTMKGFDRSISVAMTQGDAERFVKAVEELNQPGRYVEGLINNPRYHRKYIAYGNSATSDFNLTASNYVIHKGIQIQIYYIERVGKQKSKKEKIIVKAWKFLNTKIVSPNLWYIRFCQDAMRIVAKVMYGKNLGQKYYNHLKKQGYLQSWDDVKHTKKVIIASTIYKTDIIAELERIQIDGISVMMPKKREEFLRMFLGDGKDIENLQYQITGTRRVIDAENDFVSLMAALEKQGIMEEARKAYEKVKVTRALAFIHLRKTKRLWLLVLMTKDQIAFRHLYEKRRELFDVPEEHMEESSKLLEEVKMSLERYAKYNMSFAVNSKVDAMVENLMISEGNLAQVKKIQRLRKKAKYA